MDRKLEESREQQDDVVNGFAASLIRWKVRQMADRLKLCDADRKDVEQDLRLEVLRRSKRYCAERGEWKPFVRILIERCSLNLTNGYRRRRRMNLIDGVTLGTNVTTADQHRRVLRGPLSALDATDLRLDVTEIKSRLSDSNCRLCRALQTASISEVARAEGLSNSTVSDRVHRLRQSFRKLDPVRNQP